MKRGEIWWVNFDPSIGTKIKKIRPAVIISNDLSNEALSRVQVLPITSNADRVYPCEAFLFVGDKKCKAMADQMTTVSKERFKKRISKISSEEQDLIDQAIKIQLHLK